MEKGTCPACAGSGQKWSRIEKRSFTCPTCAGHGWFPTGGPFWFYAPRQNRHAKPGVFALSDKVAVLQRWGSDGWRLSLFDQRGPITHSDAPAALTLMAELGGFRASRVAPKLLDFWSTRPNWQQGVQFQLYKAYVDTLHYHGFGSEANDICAQHPALPERIKAMARFKRQVLPEAEIF